MGCNVQVSVLLSAQACSASVFSKQVNVLTRLSSHGQCAQHECFISGEAHHVGCTQVVVASHSWGDNVFRNFLMWATEEPGADPNWAEEHIHAYINIAGPVLGVAKSITSLLSGMALHHAGQLSGSLCVM